MTRHTISLRSSCLHFSIQSSFRLNFHLRNDLISVVRIRRLFISCILDVQLITFFTLYNLVGPTKCIAVRMEDNSFNEWRNSPQVTKDKSFVISDSDGDVSDSSEKGQVFVIESSESSANVSPKSISGR